MKFRYLVRQKPNPTYTQVWNHMQEHKVDKDSAFKKLRSAEPARLQMQHQKNGRWWDVPLEVEMKEEGEA